MNIFLWVLQILMALHTGAGAVWKFSKSVQETMPTLDMIPESVWVGMGVLELLCALALIAPLLGKKMKNLAPLAAIVITIEMLVFIGVHYASGSVDHAPVIYWIVVAAICAFIAFKRLKFAK